jgi:hypothetical protein
MKHRLIQGVLKCRNTYPFTLGWALVNKVMILLVFGLVEEQRFEKDPAPWIIYLFIYLFIYSLI